MRNALWLDSLTILEEPRDFELYGRIRWRCEPANTFDHCLKCGVSADRLYKHGVEMKKVADLPHVGHHVFIQLDVQRYRCRECGGTFDHPLPEIDENRKMTKRCVAYVREHGKRRTFADIAREIGVDEKTIRNVCKEGFVQTRCRCSSMRRRTHEMAQNSTLLSGLPIFLAPFSPISMFPAD